MPFSKTIHRQCKDPKMLNNCIVLLWSGKFSGNHLLMNDAWNVQHAQQVLLGVLIWVLDVTCFALVYPNPPIAPNNSLALIMTSSTLADQSSNSDVVVSFTYTTQSVIRPVRLLDMSQLTWFSKHLSHRVQGWVEDSASSAFYSILFIYLFVCSLLCQLNVSLCPI